MEMSDETKSMMKKVSSVQLNALIEPDNTTYKEIEWIVSGEGLATIYENGVLTAHSSEIIIVAATTQCGKTNDVEIEIYSNTGLGAMGICGTAVVIGTGAAIYFKKKKEQQDTDEI